MKRMRRAVELLVVFLALDLLVRTWLLGGVTVPFVIPSASMAPTLLGIHRDVTCDDCGFPFSCEADVERISPLAVCPNCGYRENAIGPRPDISGDRVLVDRATLNAAPPERWDVVVFRHPATPSEAHVKRVIGLPREAVQIRDGDVYVDGEIRRKPWPVQRSMAVLVHDASFCPRVTKSLPLRWQPDPGTSAWQGGPGPCRHPGLSSRGPVDWLTYHHWQQLPGQPGRIVETPITDDLGYHQSRLRRAEDVSAVPDLLLSFRVVRATGQGRLWVRAWDGREEFRLAVEVDEPGCQLLRNGEEVASCDRFHSQVRLEGSEITVAVCDRQVVLAIDDRPQLVHPYAPGQGAVQPSARPVAVGTDGPAVEIRDLKLYRDVYYARPPLPDARWGIGRPVRLGADEYFVAGDNSPFSDDSRTWPEGPGVSARLLVGRAFFVHIPMGRIELLGSDFQVPVPARIGYIR